MFSLQAQRAGSSARMNVLVDTAKAPRWRHHAGSHELRGEAAPRHAKCPATRDRGQRRRSELDTARGSERPELKIARLPESPMIGANGAERLTRAGPRSSIPSSIRTTSRPVKVFGPTAVRTNMTASSVPSKTGKLFVTAGGDNLGRGNVRHQPVQPGSQKVHALDTGKATVPIAKPLRCHRGERRHEHSHQHGREPALRSA